MSIPEFLLDPDRQKETDNAIMETVKELSERLGRTGHDPRKIIWADYKGIAPDWPVFDLVGKLVLRSELKGKLTLAEWRPLLASSLVFETRFRGRERLLRVYAVSALAISIFLTVLFFLFILRNVIPSSPASASTGKGYGGLTIGFFLGVFFPLIAIPAPYFRRLRLRADQIASEEFGTQQDLVTVLKKIEDMSISPGGRIDSLTTLAPTISRRIRNLATQS